MTCTTLTNTKPPIPQQQPQQHKQTFFNNIPPQTITQPYKLRRHKRLPQRLPEHQIEQQLKDQGRLIQRQTFFNQKPTEIITPKQKFSRPKHTVGRPNERISEDELHKAAKIIQWDIQKQGEITKWRCPQHGKLERSFDVDLDGARVWCELCGLTTHFTLYNYNPADYIHDSGRISP